MSTEQDWTSECPTEAGVWEYKHAQMTGEPIVVEVDVCEGMRWANYDGGSQPLLSFHGMRYNPQWRAHKAVESEAFKSVSDIHKATTGNPAESESFDRMLRIHQLETRLAEAERILAGSESCHFETEQEWRSLVELLDGSTTEECLASLHKLKAERDAWKGVAGRLGALLKDAVAFPSQIKAKDEALAELERLERLGNERA